MNPLSLTMQARLVPEPRYLHAGHFAFMRAVIQGLDFRDSWDRYLRVEGAHGDVRQVRRTIGWIRDVFAAAARRHGRPGTARLVVLELSSPDGTTPGLPVLADFVHAENLENFSEAEQMYLYQQRYALSARSQVRRTRLLERQLEALNWLQQTISQSPQSSDAIANWIHPALATHLAWAGLHRLDDLIHHMDCFGARWWRRIDAIGATKAARIAQWVAIHPTLGGVRAASARGKPSSSIGRQKENALRPPAGIAKHDFMPLDQLKVPPDVTQDGPLRGQAATCRIAATDDLSAIRAWLAAKGSQTLSSTDLHDWSPLASLSHTQRAYWKEAERFLLWLTLERQIGLTSVSAQDCEMYRDFLTAPTAVWCASRGRGKWHPEWRPFEGPLSLAARRFAVTVLRGMYRYLVKQRYLTSSPWETVAAAPSPTQKRRCGFDDRAWQTIDQALAGLLDSSANHRLALAIAIISTTGMRVGQLAQSRVGDLVKPDGETYWHLQLREPGRAGRYLPLPLSVSESACKYLRARGLDADPQAATNRGAYLLGMAADAAVRAPWAPCARQPYDPAAGIGAGTLRDQIKHFFRFCSARVAATEPQLAAQFAAASSEWLRAGRSGGR